MAEHADPPGDLDHPTDDDVVALARRVIWLCQGIAESHRLGTGPAPMEGVLSDQRNGARGTGSPALDNVLTRDYIEELAQAYTRRLPWPVVAARAQWARDTARFMGERGAPSQAVATEWEMVERLVRIFADRLLDMVPEGTPVCDEEFPPNFILRFDLLGDLSSAEAVTVLDDAARAVERALVIDLTDDNPLTDEETELVRALVEGKAVGDIAVEFGHSERSVYRKLRTVWDKVGVASRAEGIALVAARGWLREPLGS